MSRRAISIVTAIIATFVAFAMPISQLRRPIEVTCCCPNPEHCRCPHDPATSKSTKSMMQACHRVTHDANTPVPSVTIATVETEVPHDRIALAPVTLSGAPRPSPDLPRPSAPS